jgi:hypothetical protein
MTDPYPDPKHRPIWRSGSWRCLCGAYLSDRLDDIEAHIARRTK